MLDNSEVKEKDPSLVKYAMHYGVILGLFWVLKYLLLMGVAFSELFKYLFYVFNVGTFLLIYIFTYKFKESDAKQIKKASQCILFSVLLCLFASFFEGAIMYAHYKFIDPAYFTKITEPFLLALDKVDKPASMSYDEYMKSKEIAKDLFSMETVHIMGKFIENIFLGLFLGVFMALVIGNRKK